MCCLTKYEMRSFYVFSEMPHCNDGGKSRLGQGEMCYHLNMRMTAHILRQQVLESSQFCTCLFKLIECFKKFKQECMHCISLLINLLVTGFNKGFFFIFLFNRAKRKQGGSRLSYFLSHGNQEILIFWALSYFFNQNFNHWMPEKMFQEPWVLSSNCFSRTNLAKIIHLQ